MNKTYRFLALLLIISLASCSSPSHFPKTKGLIRRSSFGFMSNGDEYYFGLTQIERKDKICNSYVGFKNSNKFFKFNSADFKKLEMVYALKISPEEKISLALKEIRKLNDLHPKESCYKKADWKDGIVWGAIALALWPVTIVVGAAEIINNTTDKMDDIYLGMTLEEMKKTLEVYELRSRIEGHHSYYVADQKAARMVMYFKENKLMAFVRGINPDHYKR